MKAFFWNVMTCYFVTSFSTTKKGKYMKDIWYKNNDCVYRLNSYQSIFMQYEGGTWFIMARGTPEMICLFDHQDVKIVKNEFKKILSMIGIE